MIRKNLEVLSFKVAYLLLDISIVVIGKLVLAFEDKQRSRVGTCLAGAELKF